LAKHITHKRFVLQFSEHYITFTELLHLMHLLYSAFFQKWL